MISGEKTHILALKWSIYPSLKLTNIAEKCMVLEFGSFPKVET